MPKTERRKPRSEDRPETELPLLEEEQPGPGNGATHEEPEETVPAAPPAQMEVKMRGSASAVRAAAQKIGEQPRAPERRKEEPEEPPIDENAPLLADPKNMVVVTRQLPRVWELRSGQKVRCAIKVEKYGCPMRREEIEEDVFSRFGGKKYNVTIHPNTTTGENVILGAFPIEHPNPEEPPYIEDPEAEAQDAAALAARIPGGTDPTLRETDSMVNLKVSLERRLDRARQKKEIKELEKIVREEEQDEDKPKPPAIVPTGPDPRDQEIARLKEQLAEKKVDDRFIAMQNSISQLTQTVQSLATRPVTEPKSNDNSLFLKVVEMSNTHSKEMLDVVKLINRPVAPVVSTEDNFDKMLDRLGKMKTAMGGDDSRVMKFQDQLLEIAMERALGGAEDGEEEDTMKFAIKQFTPVLKTYVERQIEKEEGGGKGGDKQPVSKERLKEIYAEAGAKAAKEIAEKWQREGLVVKAGPDGKPALPAPGKKGAPVLPKNLPPGKVVGRQKTAEGIIEHIQIVPADLSGKPKKQAEAPEAPIKEETEEVKYTEMPGIGKIEIPALPGELRYDRKKSVNFVLDSILSEISEGTPQKGTEDPKIESYVPADALEYLDNELLAEIHKATSGDELEGSLGAWGDRAKLDAIKEAGKDKAIDSWVRRLIRTIQDIWRDRQKE